jgi:RecB family exonuclease
MKLQAVEKLKSEGKISILDFQTTSSQTDYVKKQLQSSQFSANFEPMLDGSFDYMQMHIFVRCHGIH